MTQPVHAAKEIARFMHVCSFFPGFPAFHAIFLVLIFLSKRGFLQFESKFACLETVNRRDMAFSVTVSLRSGYNAVTVTDRASCYYKVKRCLKAFVAL